MELCVIYNFSQRYREGIFRLIDSVYECHWVFGNNDTDIKGLDNGVLKDVSFIDNKKIFGSIYYQKGVVSLLKKYDTFLMLGEVICLSTWLVLLYKKLFFRSKKIYLWSHGWYGREGFVKKFLKKIYFSLADATFLYGNYAKDVAVNQGYSKDNLYVIHNSLNYSEQLSIRKSLKPSIIFNQHFGNHNPVLIFIGRLTKVKRLDMIVEALSILKTKGEDYNLVLVGDGTEMQALKQDVEEKNLCDNIWFYGASYDEKENAQLIFNADLCVAPGNVGLTAMHSMVFGTPVITHDDFAWQMPEFEAIKPGKTGDFFLRDNVDSLALCIQNWINVHKNERADIRNSCYSEIDGNWTPEYQMNVIRKVLTP